MTTIHEQGLSLNRPLPAAVAVGSARWWLSYRNYAVFAWPWVWRRALLFGLFVVAWGSLSGIAHYAGGGSAVEAAKVFAAFTLGLLVMINAGPALAAAIRHRHLALRKERWFVVGAIAAGLLVAFLVDLASSSMIAAQAGQEFQRELGSAALAANLLVLLVIYTLIGGGLALRAYLSEARRLSEYRAQQDFRRLQSEKLAADQQLAMLQAQIEPHFLFNTLATVRSSLRGDPARAEDTLDALCEYLRTTIPRLRKNDANALSTVDEQLEICRRYLAVMQHRMGERLAFNVQAEDEVRSLGFPPFILLSLVENAVRHGVEPQPKGGRIDISADRRDGQLCLSVSDTGVGLSQTSGAGVGLSNIRRQLKLRYGEAARLRVESGPEGGVEARIIVPLEDDS